VKGKRHHVMDVLSQDPHQAHLRHDYSFKFLNRSIPLAIMREKDRYLRSSPLCLHSPIMYRAFNLSNCNWGEISRESGDAIYKRHSDVVRKALESFLNDKILNGAKLSAHWFPTIKADVFISHSHKDEADAIKCASWLKNNFGLESFIDSCVWGQADELLRIIDEKYCLNVGGESYDYNKRNRSTSHVHMMLANGLNEMLEAAECVFFINSANSITSNEAVSKTQSPWLFLELGTMRIIRRKKPERMGILIESAGQTKSAAELNVEYSVPLNELTAISVAHLNEWVKARAGGATKWPHPLDLLYKIAPETR
jgi:hypothetical protein